MRLHECICTPTRVCIYMYMHTYTQTHIYFYTYICTCTYTCIHANTYTHTCTCTPIYRQKISATTLRHFKKYHRRTCASIYICMHVHIYINLHICAQPAANVSQMCTLISKEHLNNAYNCTCTGAQNTCSKVHATLTPKRMHTSVYIHTYAYAYISTRIHICIYDTVQTRWRTATEAQNLCTNMHEHTYTHVYTCMRIPINIHMQIYTYMHVRTHTYIHIYTHTHRTCNNGAAATAKQ